MIDESITTEHQRQGIGDVEGAIQSRNEVQTGGAGSEISDGNVVGESRPTKKESSKIKAEDLSEKELQELEIFIHEMNNRHIPSFNALTIRRAYPKAFQALWEFVEDKGAYQGQLDDATMIGIMAYTSRMITFDFFDSKGIYVSIAGDKHSWEYTITYEDELYVDEGKSTRTLTEVQAFLKAFEILENQLK